MSTAKLLLLIIMLERIKCEQQEKCAKLEIAHVINDTIYVSENDYLNLTFWVNVSQCDMSDNIYTLTMKMNTAANILDQDERIQITNNTCAFTHRKSFRCVSPHGPVEMYRQVNRSHNEIEWKWRWKYNQSFIESCKTVKLNVHYLPTVTKLTVNGEEVRGNNTLLDEGQAVSIICFFDKRNPSSTFSLYHAHGNKTAVGEEGKITHSVAATGCEQDWPVVRCEGQGSTENRSLYFLVKCAPQFTDSSPKLINSVVNGQVMLNIKAHTTLVNGCLLTHISLAQNFSRERNFSLLGSPPNLSLVLHLEHADKSTRGNWSLTVTNNIGIGKIDLIFVNASVLNEKENKASKSAIAVIAGLLCGDVLLIITAVAFIVIWRIRKHKCDITIASMDDERKSMIYKVVYSTSSCGGLVSVALPARQSQESRRDTHPNHGPSLYLQRRTATTMELPEMTPPLETQNSQTNCEETESIDYENPDGENFDSSTAAVTMKHQWIGIWRPGFVKCEDWCHHRGRVDNRVRYYRPHRHQHQPPGQPLRHQPHCCCPTSSLLLGGITEAEKNREKLKILHDNKSCCNND